MQSAKTIFNMDRPTMNWLIGTLQKDAGKSTDTSLKLKLLTDELAHGFVPKDYLSDASFMQNVQDKYLSSFTKILATSSYTVQSIDGFILSGSDYGLLLGQVYLMHTLGKDTVVNIPDLVGKPCFETLLVIGDWSDDGHGYVAYHLLKANKPVQDLREAHFKSGKMDNLFKLYEQNTHTVEEFYDMGLLDHLKELFGQCNKVKAGLQLKIIDEEKNMESVDISDWLSGQQSTDKFVDIFADCEISMSLATLFHLWVLELNTVDPDLNACLIYTEHGDDYGLLSASEASKYFKNTPPICFYGFDKTQRHLKVPGYGLFDEYAPARFNNHCG